jgi:hypothetical protein
MEKLFYSILTYSFLLIPLFLLVRKCKLSGIIVVLFIYGITFFLLNNYYYDFPKKYRQLIQAVYTFLEYLTFSFIIWEGLKNKFFRKLIAVLCVLFLIFIICFNLLSGVNRIDSIPVGVESILIFIYSFFYFRQFFTSPGLISFKSPGFLIIVGILIYLGGTFFFNIFANYLSVSEMHQYWWLTYIPEIIKNILFTVAIFKIMPHVKKNVRVYTNKALS